MELIKIINKPSKEPTKRDIAESSDRLATKVILVNEKGEIANIHFTHSGLFMLPGGKLDPGETPEEAAVRETKEETGYDIEITHELGQTIDYKDKLKQKGVNYCYVARPIGEQGGRALTENEKKNGAPDLVWLTPEESTAKRADSYSITGSEEELYVIDFIKKAEAAIIASYMEQGI